MANVLETADQAAIVTLWQQGWSRRRIAREPGSHRETVARYIALTEGPRDPASPRPAVSKPAIPTLGSALSEPFASKTLRKYQRRLDTIDATLLSLFVEDLATRAFEPALRLLVGQEAPLSLSTISRLTRKFQAEHDALEQEGVRSEVCLYLGGPDLPEGKPGHGKSVSEALDRSGY